MSQPHQGPNRGIVTGASGFIGRYLVRDLEEAGWHVTGVSLRDQDRSPHAAFSTRAAEGAVVFHLAGVASGDGETDETLDRVNRELAVQSYLACASRARSFVYLSSSRVFGARVGKVDETTDVEPDDAYGRSKADAEASLRAIEDPATPLMIVRSPPVYGAGCKGNLVRLLGLVDGPCPLPFGRAHAPRSYVAAVNLASALRWLASRVERSGGDRVRVWHVADCELSTRELCERLASAAGRRPLLVPVPMALLAALTRATLGERTADTLLNPLQFDGTRLIATGWCPPQDPCEGFEEMVTWFRSRSRR